MGVFGLRSLDWSGGHVKRTLRGVLFRLGSPVVCPCQLPQARPLAREPQGRTLTRQPHAAPAPWAWGELQLHRQSAQTAQARPEVRPLACIQRRQAPPSLSLQSPQAPPSRRRSPLAPPSLRRHRNPLPPSPPRPLAPPSLR